MKKNRCINGIAMHSQRWKIFLIMKLQMVFILGFLLQSVAGVSQVQSKRFDFQFENKTLKEVIQTLEDQTDFSFVYKDELINSGKRVNATFKDKLVTEVIEEVIKDENLTYSIVGRAIVIMPKDESLSVNQQKIKLSGKVTDTSGQPLPGVTVVVKGTTNGTITNFDGVYTLSDVPSDGTIQFSFVGMKMQEIPIDGKTSIDVVMEEDAIGLEEVVAIGYGSMKKSDLTGSVSSVSSDDLTLTPLKNLSSMIQGSVSGVEIIKGSGPGSGSIVRIRGGNSMNGSNDPLYVVDGFPGASIGNPNDIESIQILKDASATAIYGSRGANGVIIVTTKRGKSVPSISFDASYGIQQVRKKLDLLNAKDYAELANEKASNSGLPQYFDNVNDLDGDTDWQDEIFQLAPIANYNISVSGGNDINKYLITGNYFTQDGLIKNSDFSSANIRTNLDNKVNDWFHISTSIYAAHDEINSANILTYPGGVVYKALQAPAVAPVYSEDGEYYNIANVPTAETVWENPMTNIDGFMDKNVNNQFTGNVNLEFDIYEGLKYSFRVGAKYLNHRQDKYWGSITQNGAAGGKASIMESDKYNYLNESILSYKKLINDKHDLNITAGFSWEEETYSYFTAGASGFLNDNLLTDNLSSGSIVSTPISYKSNSTILSWIGRVNYIFNNKYLFTITGRADGSSRLGANNKWGFFPSGAFGWRVSEEEFMKNLKPVSNLKLRASYGMTGNQEIGRYMSLSRLASESAYLGADETRRIAFVPNDLQNPNLKWEVTNQLDVGFDLGLFEQKIDMTFDYYIKKTSDLLATVPLAISSGYTEILKNFGDMENKGFELGITSNLYRSTNWSFSLGLNLSANRNKVLRVATETGQFFASSISTPVDSYVNIIKEGYPLSSFYGYLEDGLWATDQTTGSIQPTAHAGDQKYIDTNLDGSITDADKVILGNPYPDFIYGLSPNLTYKNINLNILIQGVQGGLLFNANKFVIGDSFARNGNQLQEVKDSHWSIDNPDVNAKYPRVSNVAPKVSERFFEDASYLRFKTISLSYNFPADNINWFDNAVIFISGENLITITNYSGYDPEVSSMSSSSLNKGIDVGAYPSSKIVTIGLKINL